MAVLDPAHKLAKEAFVTGHRGGSAAEVASATFVLALGTEVPCMISAAFPSIAGRNSWAAAALSVAFSALWPALVLCLPDVFLSAQFLACSYATWGATLLLTAFYCLIGDDYRPTRSSQSGALKESKSKIEKNVIENSTVSTRIHFVDAFRVSLMTTTCAAILAVDFPAFPRRFAKTETSGVSLMDLGVGLFVVSLGLSSGLTALKDKAAKAAAVAVAVADPSAEVVKSGGRSFFRSCFVLVRRASPIIALAVARVTVIKVLGYQEHQSEYGEHWNFFMTLAAMVPIAAAAASESSEWTCALAACFTITMHQMSLFAGLTLFVTSEIDEDKENDFSNSGYLGALRMLVYKNRPGIVSLPGYAALLLFGRAFGVFLTNVRRNSTALLRCRISGDAFMGMLLFCCGWGCQMATEFSYWPPSESIRRVVNLAYVVHVLCNAAIILGVHALTLSVISAAIICLARNRNQTCCEIELGSVFDRVSKHSLLVFLIANLTTGFVNMSINTLSTGTFYAIAIVSVHNSCAVLSPFLVAKIKGAFFSSA